MKLADHIKAALRLPTTVVNMYLKDLTDEQLLLRPNENANHIAWQLGHLISSEYRINEMLFPGSAPDLPEGFIEKHEKDMAGNNSPDDFYTKKEYFKAMEEQRQATLAILDRLSNEELDKPSPEPLRIFGENVGLVLAGHVAHWMMHAGQWVVVRRVLGKKALF